jgi:hypothetical protein
MNRAITSATGDNIAININESKISVMRFALD